MVFKVSLAFLLISLIIIQSAADTNCLESESEVQIETGTTEVDQPAKTTMSPLISALSTKSLPLSETSTKVPMKSDLEMDEELVQQLKMYLTLLDQHIKLSGRPRFGRSVPLVLPIN